MAQGALRLGSFNTPLQRRSACCFRNISKARVRPTTAARSEELERLEAFFAVQRQVPSLHRQHRPDRRSEFDDTAASHAIVGQVGYIGEAASPAGDPLPSHPTSEPMVARVAESQGPVVQRWLTEQGESLEAASHQATSALSGLAQRTTDGVGALGGRIHEMQLRIKGQATETLSRLSWQKSSTSRPAATAEPPTTMQAAAQSVPKAKKAVQTPVAAAPAPSTSQSPATAATAAAEAPVGVRLQREVHEGIAALESLTSEQLASLQQAVRALQQSVVQRAQHAQESTSAALLRVKEVGGRHLRAPQMPSVSIPSVQLPAALAPARVRATLLDHLWAVALVAVVLVAAAIRWFSSRNKSKTVDEAVEARARARSRQALDRQRSRFQRALATSGDGGVDTSVFSAMQKKGSSSSAATTAAAFFIEEDLLEEETDVEDPESWDVETRKQWETFVSRSRLRESQLWNVDNVDEGLPEIYVDLEKE